VQLVFEHLVSAPLEPLFAFHEHPANLALLLDGWPGFRMLRHTDSIEVGAEVWIEQLIAPLLPVVMGFRHVEHAPPVRFAEQLIHGPFDVFHHIHEFEARGAATLVRDRVEFRVRRLYGGGFTTRVYVEPVLRRLFAFRAAALDRWAARESAAQAPFALNATDAATPSRSARANDSGSWSGSACRGSDGGAAR
jgi:ligand-binding SRPBCC domain-containing protein